MTNKHEIYFKAAESAKIGVWEIDLIDNEIYWDPVIKKILELPADYIPEKGSGAIFFSEGENRSKIQQYLTSALEKGVSFNDKFEIVTAKNNIKYIECICETEILNGKTSRLLGTFQDITNEQNLINKLEVSVEKFSSVFSSANDAIIIVDSETGLIADCNARFYEMTSYTRKDLIGLHNSELFPEDKKKAARIFYNKQLRKDEYAINETYLKTRSEKLIPVEVASGKKFTVSYKTYLVCFFRDISERKKANDNITMLSLVAAETTDSVIITNPEGEVLWVNKAFTRLTGYNLIELEGKKPTELLIGPRTDLEKVAIIRAAIKNKENVKVSLLNYDKNKRKYWFELNITPIFDNLGNCIKFVTVGRDITEQKERELELKTLLDVTNHQNSKLYNFAHIVSHNIRSHTSNLSMILDVMDHTDDLEEKISYVDYLKEGTQKLTETIEYLNDIITIQRNTNIEKKAIFIKNEIERTKKSLNQTIIESGIHITVNIPDELKINVIPAYLDSILLNLTTNAIKYQSPDRKPTLEIGYEVQENHTVIIFKDNGIGINLERHGHKMFGMYKTFHGNEDARGIGLFMTKNQIEAMKGQIEVESEEGIGTTFKIYFNDKK